MREKAAGGWVPGLSDVTRGGEKRTTEATTPLPPNVRWSVVIFSLNTHRTQVDKSLVKTLVRTQVVVDKFFSLLTSSSIQWKLIHTLIVKSATIQLITVLNTSC